MIFVLSTARILSGMLVTESTMWPAGEMLALSAVSVTGYPYASKVSLTRAWDSAAGNCTYV